MMINTIDLKEAALAFLPFGTGNAVGAMATCTPR